MRKAYLILGVNGAGKTSFYKDNLKDKFINEDVLYINADEIKQELVKNGLESNYAKIKSGQVAVSKMSECIKQNKNFAFETTFTDNGQMGSVAIVKELKKNGYEVEGYFIHTKDVNINIERVGDRFTKGTGHYVPAEVIKERYDLCVKNVTENSQLFDKFNYIDNTNLDYKISDEKILEKEIKKVFKHKALKKDNEIER